MAGLKVGIVFFLRTDRIGTARAGVWTNEVVVQVSRGSKKRGNSATDLELLMVGICGRG